MKSKRILTILVLVALASHLISVVSSKNVENTEDEDFSEFDDQDDFDEDVPKKGKPSAVPQNKEVPSKNADLEENEVADEDEPPVVIHDKRNAKNGDDDDEVVVEDDDFEGIDDDEFDDEENTRRREPPPKLTITPVPMPMRGWQAYWSELLVMSGIVVYLINYILGRYKNQRIAQAFFEINWSLLEDNFAVLGDGTKSDDEQGTKGYQKLSDSQFQMWCSGRICCEGMLVELKLLKRQDLVSILSNIFRPQRDLLRFQVEMSKEDMDSIVFAVANKKASAKISKELNDLVNYCPDKRAGEKYGLNSQMVVMSELGEVATGLLDSKTTSVINKYAHLIESIHFTDQFSGLRSQEPEIAKDGVLKMPDVHRFLFFTIALPTSVAGNNAEEASEEMKNFFQFVFYSIDRVKRFRLSREGKQKADKNRAKVEDAFMKQTHVARAEAAAVRREEKRRQEKERILQVDDPEVQRRWEEREQKREKKRKAPKMKQLKVKAL